MIGSEPNNFFKLRPRVRYSNYTQKNIFSLQCSLIFDLFRPEEEIVLRDKSQLSRHGHLNRESRRLGESSPSLHRLHVTETQRSLGEFGEISLDYW